VTTARIAQRILVIRGQKVMIDADLAELYGTQTRTLNQAVRRNRERFPKDFVFQLTKAEKQEVITNCDHLARLRFSPALPYAFTEHGALMAASMLNTPLAVEVSVYVVRAFVQLRELIASNRELALKLKELEQRLERRLDTHDQAITELMHAIRQLMASPETKKRPIGFIVPEEKKRS
jgi:ATP-dependent Clp protease ATP-binding subunit ClpA